MSRPPRLVSSWGRIPVWWRRLSMVFRFPVMRDGRALWHYSFIRMSGRALTSKAFCGKSSFCLWHIVPGLTPVVWAVDTAELVCPRRKGEKGGLQRLAFDG
ncbi:hypothetical protein VM1G_11353 [Cytospora mali]|uniref:Uncharacterized protein n=1 Tax=Cytospora mali TaxID=578113 RepID=A0A194VK16_CYTMA|nr:hypothetical protein VM1G_11353 [Valsa mali]